MPVEVAAPEQLTDSRLDRTTLTINELFVSIQGESTWVGKPCVFVRTTGCPLRCRWCDTEYAFHEGTRRSLDNVCAEVCQHAIPLVEITGGEPLAQPAVPALAAALLERGKTVLVETSGAFDISVLPKGAMRIMDLKCPGSGECDRNDFDNIGRLTAGDEIKFVVADRLDYEWAVECIEEYGLAGRFPVLMSSVWDELPPAELARWILEDQLPVRLQLQMHKILWPGVERGI